MGLKFNEIKIADHDTVKKLSIFKPDRDSHADQSNFLFETSKDPNSGIIPWKNFGIKKQIIWLCLCTERNTPS